MSWMLTILSSGILLHSLGKIVAFMIPRSVWCRDQQTRAKHFRGWGFQVVDRSTSFRTNDLGFSEMTPFPLLHAQQTFKPFAMIRGYVCHCCPVGKVGIMIPDCKCGPRKLFWYYSCLNSCPELGFCQKDDEGWLIDWLIDLGSMENGRPCR